jgi:hypothetical protein
MGGLPLHREKGVNPHMTYCPRCRGDGPELILLGAHDRVYKCNNSDCGMLHIGKPPGGVCQECKTSVFFERNIEDHERLPGGLCDNCVAQVKMVQEGGVFFKCADCNAIGSIKADHPLSIQVRKQLNVEAPKPCGVAFTKNDCPVCTGQVEDTDGK